MCRSSSKEVTGEAYLQILEQNAILALQKICYDNEAY